MYTQKFFLFFYFFSPDFEAEPQQMYVPVIFDNTKLQVPASDFSHFLKFLLLNYGV